MSFFKSIVEGWDRFWFSPQDLMKVSIFRICLGSALFLIAAVRTPYVQYFYGASGILPLDKVWTCMPEIIRPAWLWPFWMNLNVELVHYIYLFLLALVVFGLGGRLVTFVAWVLHVGFMQRNPMVFYGADIIGGLLLLYLSGMKSMEYFSLQRLLFKRRDSGDLLHSVFVRIAQVQMSIIYAMTGFEKLKGASWWDGTAVWTLFGNTQRVPEHFRFFQNFVFLLAILTYATVLFEVYFPVGMFNRKLRPYFMLVGISFHTAIAIILHLPGFSCVMMSSYLLFLDGDGLRELVRIVTRKT